MKGNGDRYYLDLDEDCFVKGSEKIPLSRTQVHILHTLALYKGHPVTSQILCLFAWGNGVDSLSLKNDLYVQIHRIRERIDEDYRNPTMLITVRGYGYMLCADLVSRFSMFNKILAGQIRRLTPDEIIGMTNFADGRFINEMTAKR